MMENNRLQLTTFAKYTRNVILVNMLASNTKDVENLPIPQKTNRNHKKSALLLNSLPVEVDHKHLGVEEDHPWVPWKLAWRLLQDQHPLSLG